MNSNPYQPPASPVEVSAASSIPTLLRLPVRAASILYCIWLIPLILIGGPELIIQDPVPITCIGLAAVAGLVGSWHFATRAKWRAFVLLWAVTAALPVIATVQRAWSQGGDIFGGIYLGTIAFCILTAVGFGFCLPAGRAHPEAFHEC